MKNGLSLCEGKQIASVSDFSLPQWIVPWSWLHSRIGLLFCSRQNELVLCGQCVYVWSGLATKKKGKDGMV